MSLAWLQDTQGTWAEKAAQAGLFAEWKLGLASGQTREARGWKENQPPPKDIVVVSEWLQSGLTR